MGINPHRNNRPLYHSLLKVLSKAVNTFWHKDTSWWHRTWLALFQVMASGLAAPNNYLNQCWLIINIMLSYSQDSLLEICTFESVKWSYYSILVCNTLFRASENLNSDMPAEVLASHGAGGTIDTHYLTMRCLRMLSFQGCNFSCSCTVCMSRNIKLLNNLAFPVLPI